MATPSADISAGWTAELERSGSAVFPQRRRRLLIRLGVILLLMTNSLVSFADALRHDELTGIGGLLDVVSVALWLPLGGITVWQIVTGRPTLTVDRDGIRLGRRHRGVAWQELAGVGEPTGIPGFRLLPLLPKDRWSKQFAVPQDNVDDLDAFAAWLRGYLDQARATDHGPPHAPAP